MKVKVGSDVDDVLTPWYYSSHEWSVKAGITNGVTRPTAWAAHEDYAKGDPAKGCTLEQWLAAVYPMALDGFYLDVEPYPGAVKNLKRLKDADMEVHLITSRGAFAHGERIKADTEEWVRRHFPFVDSLTFSSDKTKPRTDYFLDDLPKNIDKVLLAGIKGVLHNQPWNRGIPGYDRVRNVKGFVDLVLGEGYHAAPRKKATALV